MTHAVHGLIGSSNANHFKAMVALATSALCMVVQSIRSVNLCKFWQKIKNKHLLFDYLLNIALRNVWFSHSTSESATALKYIIYKAAKCGSEIY